MTQLYYVLLKVETVSHSCKPYLNHGLNPVSRKLLYLSVASSEMIEANISSKTSSVKKLTVFTFLENDAFSRTRFLISSRTTAKFLSSQILSKLQTLFYRNTFPQFYVVSLN